MFILVLDSMFGERLVFNLELNPFGCITTGGVDAASRWHIESDGKYQQSKPRREYKVPSMGDVESIEKNNIKVVSTFSGCGGSCLGYRMAGMNVVWANDCDPSAQDSYRLNHKHTILDTRDIRNIQGKDILDATGLSPGDVDIFDGSPPCTSFSMAGKRAKLWGVKTYHAGLNQRMDDLFFEYIRILRELKPKVFIAENVKGLISGVAKGLFKIILSELKNSGYNVRVQLMDAKWLGVPQKRQRVIFIGTRNDLSIEPVFPLPLKHQYTGADALYDSIYTGEKTTARELTINECKRICSFPDDFNLDGSIADQWSCLGNAVPPLMMRQIAYTVRDELQRTI